MRWPQVKQGPLRTTRTLVPSIHLSGKFSSRIFRTKHLPVLSNCGVSVGEIIEHVIKYQVNRTERNRSLSLPRQGFDVKHAERKITVTSLLLSSFWALQLCAPDHTLISAPTRLGFYWCHLQWVRNFCVFGIHCCSAQKLVNKSNATEHDAQYVLLFTPPQCQEQP